MESKDQDVKATKEMIKLRNRMVYDITTRLESFSLNTVISGFMEYNNKFIDLAKKEGGIDKETLETIACLLYTSSGCPAVMQNSASYSIFGNMILLERDLDLADGDIFQIGLELRGKAFIDQFFLYHHPAFLRGCGYVIDRDLRQVIAVRRE